MTREYAPTRPVRPTERGWTVLAWLVAGALLLLSAVTW